METRTSSVGLPPAVAATTTLTGVDLNNAGCSGVTRYLKTTVIGTGSVTLSIQGKDTASGDYYTLLSGAAVTTNTTNRYTLHPSLTPVANTVANAVLPTVWRIVVTANNANPASYTVGASLLI